MPGIDFIKKYQKKDGEATGSSKVSESQPENSISRSYIQNQSILPVRYNNFAVSIVKKKLHESI